MGILDSKKVALQFRVADPFLVSRWRSQGGVYTNTVVLQHHNVVLTKADKVYNVRCTYETSSKNISFGMMPVR